MIEYALLFALGFLTASLLVAVIAPAAHRRIVAYTERRIFATMPISREEVHAQKAMVRATLSAENARIASDLTRERHKAASTALQEEAMRNEAIRLTGDLKEMQTVLDEAGTQAATMRSDLRRVDMQNADLKGALSHAQVSIDALRRENQLNLDRMQRLELDLSNGKVELAARDADNESLSMRIQAVRHERDALRNDYRQSETSVTGLQQRVEQSEARLVRLEQKTLRQASDLADLDTRLDRRNRELERIRERLKVAMREKDSLRVTLKAAGLALPPSIDDDADPEIGEAVVEPKPVSPEKDVLTTRANALAARVADAFDSDGDAALRTELAALAAALTAETTGDAGMASRIRDIVGPPEADGSDTAPSLARRIRRAMGERAGAALAG